jgi:arylsulfatase A-like enzyme
MNLLLVSIDSLRLDFAPGFGNKVHTPRFAELSRDFCHSPNCFSTSSATRPVHTSLFTGLYPFEHGIESQKSPSMRQGVTDLFALGHKSGCEMHGFSEVPEIFTGLRYAPYIRPMPDNQNLEPLFKASHAPTFVFLHYWSVHTPYGAADGLAFGETGKLLAEGRLDLVQERYKEAIEKLFEARISPLLNGIDLATWSVFLISDHGESWKPDEPYHGQTLRNDVIRVPLYYHIPGTGNPPPGRELISLIDLFPTALSLLELDCDYLGFGIDIRSQTMPQYYLAEIDPGPMVDNPANPEQLFPPSNRGRQWALFDSQTKFTYDQASHREELVSTFSEAPHATFADNRRYHQAYAALKSQSRHIDAELTPGADGDLLKERLRNLGYLD